MLSDLIVFFIENISNAQVGINTTNNAHAKRSLKEKQLFTIKGCITPILIIITKKNNLKIQSHRHR